MFLKTWADPGLFLVYFRPFLIPTPISIIQIEKVMIVCLGFEPWPQDGRHKQNPGAHINDIKIFLLNGGHPLP